MITLKNFWPQCPHYRKLITHFLLALICIISAGCGSGDSDSGAILRIGNSVEPKDLDPNIVTGAVEYNILQALYEGLVNQDGDTLEIIPGVAKSWDRSKDGKSYTFHLRENAKWSNGDKVTAKDFHFSFNRTLSPALASEYAFILYYIKNAKAFNEGDITDFSKVGVKVMDELTLKIELENATPYFLSLLTHFSWYPVHAPTILKFGKMTDRNTRWTRAGNMISNGPFYLSEWKLGQYVSGKKNPHYWNNKNTKLDEIRFYPIGNANTEERAFRAGQIDATYIVPLTKIKPMIEEKSPHLRLEPDLGVYFYIFNTSKPPLNDVRVRKALSLSILRQEIADQIRQRGEKGAFYYTPPGTANYSMSDVLKEDINEAKKLLNEAGFPNGKGFPTLKLLYNTSESHRQIAVAIQDMWKSTLGINVELINQEWKVYLESRKNGNFDIARAGWIGDYNDAYTFLEIMRSDSGVNHSRWSNDEYDRILDAASSELNPDNRLKLLQQAERLALSELPTMPIYFYKRAFLLQPYVKNWPSNIMNIRDYQNMYIEKN